MKGGFGCGGSGGACLISKKITIRMHGGGWNSIGKQAREDGEMEEVKGGERLRLKEKPRQSEAPLCLPWGAWVVVLQRQHPPPC